MIVRRGEKAILRGRIAFIHLTTDLSDPALRVNGNINGVEIEHSQCSRHRNAAFKHDLGAN